MARYKIRKKADDDLVEIHTYTVTEFGEQQASYYIRLLADTFQLLAENPEIGQSCDHISPGLRRFFPSETKHGIYFRRADYGINIVRVLHQTMDPDYRQL